MKGNNEVDAGKSGRERRALLPVGENEEKEVCMCTFRIAKEKNS